MNSSYYFSEILADKVSTEGDEVASEGEVSVLLYGSKGNLDTVFSSAT